MTTKPSGPLRIPPFYCPIPVASADDAAEVNQSTLAWLDRFGLCRDREQRDYLARINIGLAASLTIPDGPTELRKIYSDATLWFYAVDDCIADETTADLSPDLSLQLLRLTRMIETPSTRVAEDHSWMTTSMRDVLLRLEQECDRALVRQWAENLHAFILNIVLSVATRPAHKDLCLDDYVVIRLGQGGQLVPKMIQLVGGYSLVSTEQLDPRVHALEEMVSFLTGWDNDIFGYDKEAFRRARYGYPMTPNVLTILARENNCSVEQAIVRAIAYRDRVVCLFMRLREQVLRDASPELTRYLIGLGQWIRGYLEWALVSERYSDPRNPGDNMAVDRFRMPTTWATDPTDKLLQPLPISTIAWWWEVLDEKAI